jgi:hypothetical protein
VRFGGYFSRLMKCVCLLRCLWLRSLRQAKKVLITIVGGTFVSRNTFFAGQTAEEKQKDEFNAMLLDMGAPALRVIKV